MCLVFVFGAGGGGGGKKRRARLSGLWRHRYLQFLTGDEYTILISANGMIVGMETQPPNSKN